MSRNPSLTSGGLASSTATAPAAGQRSRDSLAKAVLDNRSYLLSEEAFVQQQVPSVAYGLMPLGGYDSAAQEQGASTLVPSNFT